MITEQKTNKERSADRILKLKPKEGEKPLSSTGLVDPRLFTGENTLHVVRDSVNLLWYFQYDMGGLPEPLKGRFTTFEKAFKHAKDYLDRRNINIEEVID